jgi:hypothetical protein
VKFHLGQISRFKTLLKQNSNAENKMIDSLSANKLDSVRQGGLAMEKGSTYLLGA